MKITINGETRDVPDGVTVRGLLSSLDLRSEQVAIEVNGELVSREQHDVVALRPGDELEIVTLVGGG